MTQRRSDGRSERVIARRDFTKAVGITALGAITSGLGLFKPDIADADSAVQRPLSDFLGAQGTTTIFIPPVRDQGGWATNVSQPPVRFALVDYAGFEAEYLAASGISLGTTVTGSVTERPLADGRAEVQVILYTVKALTWAIEIDPNGPPSQYLSNPLLFGFRAQDLVADPTKSPALGESHLQFVFKNTAPGAPLPDLVVAFFVGPPPSGQELISAYFRANASGPLHAIAGLGPEGTPGRCIVTQTGVLFRVLSRNPQFPFADGFPVETIELRATGT